jgi:hypothetical protein
VQSVTIVAAATESIFSSRFPRVVGEANFMRLLQRSFYAIARPDLGKGLSLRAARDTGLGRLLGGTRRRGWLAVHAPTLGAPNPIQIDHQT